MRHANLLTTAMICGTVIVTAGMFARAGDLNPPPGPVGSTMHTIEDVYQEVVTHAHPVCGGTWEYVYGARTGSSAGALDVLTGSGVLHAIVLTAAPTSINESFQSCDLRLNGETIGVFGSHTSTVKTILDTRYDGVVSIRANGDIGIRVTLLYRPDPMP